MEKDAVSEPKDVENKKVAPPASPSPSASSSASSESLPECVLSLRESLQYSTKIARSHLAHFAVRESLRFVREKAEIGYGEVPLSELFQQLSARLHIDAILLEGIYEGLIYSLVQNYRLVVRRGSLVWL